ncbi:unnamed protein product, partial [Scytosiphon promiscuus]
QQARVTVVVRIRPPENTGGGGGVTAAGSYHDIAVFPAVASLNTIVRDLLSVCVRRKMGVTSGEIGSIGNGSGTTFTFDRVFWSMQAGSKGRERQGSLGRSPAPYASQNCVFEGIGRSVVENCLSGFNTCLFAYGQTGSGKTFTMMGAGSSVTAATTTAASGMAQQARAAATPNPAVGMTSVEDQHRLSATAIAGACSHGRIPISLGLGSNNASSGSSGKCHTTNIRATSASSLADGDCVISVIPRICDFLFERARLAAAKANANATAVRGVEASGGLAASTISSSSSADNGSADGVGGRSGISTSWSFGVSFTEIYMERVRDLLDTSGRPSQNLKVREHPTKGPFVEGALTATVTSARETERLLVEGQARRAVAGTNMNDASSRSHAIFTILVTKVELDLKSGAEGFTTSKVNLVDLAGSENSNSAGSAGTRLKEGAAINKSLLTLGRVIKALVDSSLEVRPRASQCRSPSKADQQTPGDVAGDGSLADPPNSRSAKWVVPSSRSLLRPPSPTQSRSSAASATSTVCDFTPTSTIGPAAAAAATSAGEIAAASEEDFAENNRASTSGGGRAGGHSRKTTLDRRRSSGSLKQQLVSRRLSRSSSAPRVSRKDGGGDDGGGGLVRHSAGGNTGRVPYRESMLTFLLKDSLGGNSHTTMIATIRPGVRYLEETMSTLRYADQAKSIVNAVKVNEDPFARTVRRLHEEIHALKRELAASRRKEALAVAQADGLRREIDLLQVVDATLIASIKRHETNGVVGQSVKLKEPRSLDECGDPSADEGGSRHGSSAVDDGFFNDITPQLTPMPPTPIAAELDEEDEEERVGNTAGPGIHRDGDGGERQTALWRKSSLHDEEDVDSSSIENDTSKHVMGDVPSDETESGDHSQVEHLLSLDPETNDKANSGPWHEGESREGTRTRQNGDYSPPSKVRKIPSIGGASVDCGIPGAELGQGLRPRATAAAGAPEQDPSPEHRWSGDGPKESAAATATSKGAVDDDILARRGVSVFVDNSDSFVVSVGDVGASNTMVETASHDDKKRGVTPSRAADRSDERHHQPSRAALDLERSPLSLLSRGALVEAAVAVARARYHGRKDEKHGTLQAASSDRDVERAEVVTLLAVVLLLCETSGGAEPSERGDEQSDPRVVLEEATTVGPVEPALAPVAVNSHTPEKSAASGSEQVSTTRELHVEASGELRTVEKQSPEATHVDEVVEADGEEGILEEKRPSTEGIDGQVSQTGKIISPLPISPRSSTTARDAAGLPCEASTGGAGTRGGTRRRAPEGKAKQGLDGTRKTGNAKGPKQVERGQQRGQEPFMQPRSSGLFETSGFLLGQSWPPLPALAPSMLTASVAAADNDGNCNTEEAWVRRWYILRRGKLTAFSGWGGGHSCVGRMLLEGCSVEDAPEKAPAGTPFTFCVRAQQQQRGRDGDGTGQAWTLQASNREEKCRWVNAIRGAADRDIDLSPPESPLDDDHKNLSLEARTTWRREHDGPSGWDDAEGADEEKPAPVVEQGRIMDTLWMSAVARRSSQGSGSGHARRSSGNILDVGTTGTCREGGGRGKDEAVSLEDEIHEEAPQSDVANAPTEGPAPTEESGEEWGDEGQVKSCVFQ